MAMIKIGFDESSKAVTAHVQIEGAEQGLKILEEATKLMDEAMRYAQRKTMQLKG
jgi:hypothetical protein